MKVVAGLLAALVILFAFAGTLILVRGRTENGFCWTCGLGRKHSGVRGPWLKSLASVPACS